MPNYFETGDFPLTLENDELKNGRSAKDGYLRGWGLEYGGLREVILADPVYIEAVSLAAGRTIQTELCRLNLFLLAKYFLPKLLEQSGSGSIFEFGSYHGGSAIFLAAVCRSLGLNVRVYGLDTFTGMPPTDKSVDAHNAGDFSGVDLAELRAYVARCGLADRLEFVEGKFEETAPAHLATAAPVLLAHIDCDVRPSVAYAYEVLKPWMSPGGYVVFDDAHTSSCLGATEVVEELVIRRDGLNCEQIWPHFVFRIWPPPEPVASSSDRVSERTLLDCRFKIHRLEGELAFALQNSAQVQRRHEQCLVELGETRVRLEQTLQRLADIEAAHAQLDRDHWRLHEIHDQFLADFAAAKPRLQQVQLQLTAAETAREGLNQALGVIRQQVGMAMRSRWLRLGRLLGVGPRFDLPE